MGQVKQDYCDACGKKLEPVTWTRGDDAGVTHFGITAWKEEGEVVSGTSGDLCLTCFDKIKTWFAGLKTKNANTWEPIPPEKATIVKPPTL